MEPRIQYAKTKDGVKIAFYTIGEGVSFVGLAVFPFSHIQLEWQIPEFRGYYERLAEKRKHVRFDARGVGLSDRNVRDCSLEATVLDLETVTERLDLARFALLGAGVAGPLAISYAAHNTERVSNLILYNSYARASDVMGTPQAQGLVSLMDRDWELFTETFAHVLTGWSSGEQAHRYAALMRESITREYLRAFFAAHANVDVTDLLPQVRCPTLVLQNRQQGGVSTLPMAKGLASGIPDARLVLLRESFTTDMEPVVEAIDEFLGEGEEPEPKADLPEGMAVILFADIANSTALTEELGDAAFREKARELDTSLRAIIGESGGMPVEGKVLGDGVLAVFTSARQAIDCALRCNAAGDSVGLQLHLGIHAGDVIREGNNVYGGAVNIAARIAAASEPGEVLVSDTVRGLARTSAGVSFEDRGKRELKGISDPLRVWAVRKA